MTCATPDDLLLVFFLGAIFGMLVSAYLVFYRKDL
jgi:uncharacterized protein involved in exopolysaccharide biosynthesis